MSLNAEQGLRLFTRANKFFVMFRTKKNGFILEKSVLDRAFTDAIDSQAVESGGEEFLNVDQLEMNFDHSASSGIIGTATNDDVHDTDNDDVNWDKYYEFLDKMCQCNSRDNGEYGDQLGPFTPEDVSTLSIASMN